MKQIVYRKGLVLGIIILLSIVAFGASNIPGTSERTDYVQSQEMINSQTTILLDASEFPNEEHSQIQISGTNTQVNAYMREGRIKRLYGEAFSYGDSPEMSADNFLQANAHLFSVDAADLDFQNLQPIMYIRDTGEYKFTGVNYVQYKEDISVFRSRLILLVKNEENYPLVHASVDLRNLDGFIPEVNQDILNPEEGINNALTMKPSLVHFTQPELLIWAGIDDMFVQPILAYSFIGDNGYKNSDSSPEKYLFVTDAETGDILYVESLIIFVDVTGNVQGKVTQDKGADICEEELPENLMWARVNIGSTVAYADENGNFIIPNEGSSPVTVESGLWGKWFRVFNQAGADTVLSKTVTPPGPVNFTHNNLNNNEYKRAEVNAYLQANVVRDFTLKYNPEYPGLNQNEFPVNVNINSNCNAFYDYQSINFFRAGGGCPNTAFSTIVHHEYGHHLVAMAGSGQGQYGEGMSDVMGVLILDDPGLAYGFFSECDTPLRTADNDLQYPCSGGIHYCGQLLSGCVWDTRNELYITDPTNYSDIISNLAINAMLLHTGTQIDPSITIDYLVLDDDNGNITDGTPHYCEIAAGFGAHSMDAPPVAPFTPDAPYGPDEGIMTIEYTFNATTIDCDGDQIYYMFDWDNGNYSEWLGPFDSGHIASASHIWKERGRFEVKVKAKDQYGRESDWSDSLKIRIESYIGIPSIKGGFFKINAVIKNNGAEAVTCVQWSITLKDGAFIGKESSGQVDIPKGGEATIESGLILGFGATKVTVTAEVEEPKCSKTIERGGRILLIYTRVNPGGE
jgi:hypothetical protein